jgi:hypothetical protein
VIRVCRSEEIVSKLAGSGVFVGRGGMGVVEQKAQRTKGGALDMGILQVCKQICQIACCGRAVNEDGYSPCESVSLTAFLDDRSYTRASCPSTSAKCSTLISKLSDISPIKRNPDCSLDLCHHGLAPALNAFHGNNKM